MKQDLYRKAALERIATVDQLDKVLKVTSPLSWLGLIGVTLIIAAVLVWSVVGTLPSTVTASGVIVNTSTSTNTYLAQANGTVEIMVNEGDLIDHGSLVARITQNGVPTDYLSDQRGYISSILADNGSTVQQGAELIRISPYVTANQPQVVVCYASVNDVDKIERGMIVNVTLNHADSSTYGHMEGRVINVDSWATSTAAIEAVVGSNNSMASTFVNNGSVCAVTCELFPAEDASESRSGYYWSNEKGRQLEITDRMMCTVKIVTEEVRPITKLFVKLKEIWGD